MKKLLDKWKTIKLSYRITAILSFLLLIYTCIGFFLFPYILKNIAQKQITNLLNRRIKISNIYFNPFSFNLRINNLRIDHKNSNSTFISFKKLEANIDLTYSLFKFAPIISNFQLDSPYISLIRYNNGKLNFQDLLTHNKLQEKTDRKKRKKNKFNFSLNNIKITNGKIEFNDILKNTKHEIKNINISLPFISNLPYALKKYHKPHIEAIIDGAKTEFKGKARPFSYPQEFYIKINQDNLNLTKFIPYLPNNIPFNLKSGTFSCNLTITFKHKKSNPFISLQGTTLLTNIQCYIEKHNLLSIKKITTHILPSNLIQNDIAIKEIEIVSPYFLYYLKNKKSKNIVSLSKQQKPNLNLQTLKTKIINRIQENISKLPNFTLQELKLVKGKFIFYDQRKNSIFRKELTNINLYIKNFSFHDKKICNLILTIGKENKEYLELKAKLNLNPIKLRASLLVDGLTIPEYSVYYKDYLNGYIKTGKVRLSTNLNILPNQKIDSPTINIKDTNFSLNNFLLINKKNNHKVIKIDSFIIKAKIFDIDKYALELDDLSVSNGRLNIIRGKNGVINLLNILELKKSNNKTKSSLNTKTKNNLKIKINKISLNPIKVTFLDNYISNNPEGLTISNLIFKAENIELNTNKKFKFILRGRLNKNTPIKIYGNCEPNIYYKINANIRINKLPLRIANGYVDEFLTIGFKKGLLWTNVLFLMKKNKRNNNIKISLKGGCTARNIVVINTTTGEMINKIKLIQLKRLNIKSISPFKLTLNTLLIDEYKQWVKIDKDGKLNITKLLRSIKRHNTLKRKQLHKKKNNPYIKLKIFELKNGNINFIDSSITPTYSLIIDNLNLKIKNLTSFPNKKAELFGSAKINKNGMLFIKGKINPLAKSKFLHLKVTIKNIGMSRLSPYTAKYIGYMIAKGKLLMNIDLLLNNNIIDLKDKVLIDQLTLGKKVKNTTAKNLPINLAIALLTDRNGQINLNIPVKGNINDPEFSIASVVFGIIKNLIIKAVTSPISILTSIFGGSEDLKYIYFPPGSAQLTPKEIHKLKILAKGIIGHPKVKIQIQGSYDPIEDKKVLEQNKFNLLIKKAKYLELGKTQRSKTSIEEIKILPKEYKKYLKKAWKNTPIPKQKNFLGFIKKQPLEVMENMLRSYCKINEGELRNLALERAQQVENYFIGKAHISANRIFIIEPNTRTLKKSIPKTCVIIGIK